MKFWDASAVVPLIVQEEETEYCIKQFSVDEDVMVWTLSKIEVFSALCRRFRDSSLTEEAFEFAKGRMNDFFDMVFEIVSISKVKERALSLLQVHPLKAADALQLASVLVATEEDPSRLPIICFDERLGQAARREGFTVNPQ
jgi:predicted nucleic acid-binding protein